jgi:fructose-1-phosphate kinase PfkB-like protein
MRYDSNLACYASLVKSVKKNYRDRVKLLIDFKFMSGPDEAMSIIGIPRDKPQDIIKPNLEEFLHILTASGLAGSGLPARNAITEKDISSFAIKLRDKYNLLGVLVSMDRAGLILVMRDRIIREKGIKIEQACPTGAGDALKAGFIYALSNGRPFEEAVHTGNLFGAATASMEGTQTVTPGTLARTEALAQAQGVKPETEYQDGKT